MRGSSYHERDYAFGQTMMTVRTHMGLTQGTLAAILGVSRKAVIDWEGGISYPVAEHLKQFIALAIQYQAFSAGHMVEEVCSLWDGAHQKALLDQTWLTTLLPPSETSLSTQPAKETTAAADPTPQAHWSNAPAVPNFYGREREVELLTGWVVAEQCRVVSVFGLGGIGKSALAVSLMHLLAQHFEVVIWRSLRDFPTCQELLDELLQVLAPQSTNGTATSLERRPYVLLEQMHKTRVLLVLDNLDAVLEEGEEVGRMRPGFGSFGRFLELTAETEHQSCVLLTSREEPASLAPLEGSQALVRSLRLASLDAASCDKLLSEEKLIGSAADRKRLIGAYSGNPLALRIVARTIVDLFNGQIGPFLRQGEVIFGGVRKLLEEQFYRLSSWEQSLLLWLTVLRKPATIDELLKVWAAPVSRGRLLEALDALYRRSLIHRGSKPHRFALQSLVMEYLTAWLITQATAEIQEGILVRLIEQGFELATVRKMSGRRRGI